MNKIRIALIEDDELTRLSIRTALLQKEEIEVVGEAATYAKGIQILQTLEPDIAIIDIVLPDGNGIELTKEVKSLGKRNPEVALKVLILALQDNRESVLAAFAAGADSYCMKDIHLDNLLEALRVTHSGKPWIDPAIARIVLQQVQEISSQQESTSSSLSKRQLEVLKLIAEGCGNTTIAERLCISVGTVQSHVQNIQIKLGANNRTQAVAICMRRGILG